MYGSLGISEHVLALWIANGFEAIEKYLAFYAVAHDDVEGLA